MTGRCLLSRCLAHCRLRPAGHFVALPPQPFRSASAPQLSLRSTPAHKFHSMSEPVVCDSVTQLDASAAGRVVVGGSHGGVYAAYLACKAQVCAVILHDAGRGKDDAGVQGGEYCNKVEIPYAAVDSSSARIGDGKSTFSSGVVSVINEAASLLGVEVGMSCADAARKLMAAPLKSFEVPPYAEARVELGESWLGEGGKDGDQKGGSVGTEAGVRTGGKDAESRRKVVLMDSISLVKPEDEGCIVVSGSHGGVLASTGDSPLQVAAFAAFFHDAGGSGVGGLAALDRRGVAACAVAASSARIGDARSIFEDGVLSVVNDSATKLGAAPGMRVKDVVAQIRTRP